MGIGHAKFETTDAANQYFVAEIPGVRVDPFTSLADDTDIVQTTNGAFVAEVQANLS